MTMHELILGAIALVVLIIWGILQTKSIPKKPYSVSFKNVYKGTKVPLIRLKVRGKFYYFLVDTGANTSIIDSRDYEGLPEEIKDLAMEEQVQITGIGDTVSVQEGKEQVVRKHSQTQSIALDLSFGPYKYNDAIFIIADLRAPFTQLERVLHEPVIGLLGTDFIKKYKWIIDFKSMHIIMPD